MIKNLIMSWVRLKDRPSKRSFTMEVLISGSCDLLLKGIDDSELAKQSLIGLPINDQDGDRLGVITHIEGDTWYGKLDASHHFNSITNDFEMILESEDI